MNNFTTQVIHKGNYTFPPEKRLLRREEFISVFSNVEYHVKQHQLQLIACNQSFKISRLGLVIPKKMLKKAVHRNRLKRLIRNHFRQCNWIISCDVIISLKQKIDPNDLYQHNIHNIINEMFQKLKYYSNRKLKKKISIKTNKNI